MKKCIFCGTETEYLHLGGECDICFYKKLFCIPFKSKEIRCPECKDWSKYSEWRIGNVGCQDCGDHTALVCPRCDEPTDHVWSEDKFESK